MKTDDLIRALASDRIEAPRPQRAVAWALAAGVGLSVLAFALALGPRPDIAQAATTLRFVFKPVLMLALAGLAWLVLLRLAEPGARTRSWLLLLVPAALVLAVTSELASLPPAAWSAAMIGSNWPFCLTLVPLLSVPPAVALLLALRGSAPTHPALAGGAAGLVAGGFAAALYALNCTDDSPLFVALWYSIAIAIVTLASARAGARLLRW